MQNNIENSNTIHILEDEVLNAYKLNEALLRSKDTQIQNLKGIIQDLQKPDVFPEEKEYKNVKIKIKDTPDENDTIFSTISSIGI